MQERVVTLDDLDGADEMFATGNYGKVQPVTRYEQHNLGPGPIAARARELYWAFAHNAL